MLFSRVRIILVLHISVQEYHIVEVVDKIVKID